MITDEQVEKAAKAAYEVFNYGPRKGVFRWPPASQIWADVWRKVARAVLESVE